MHDHVRTHIHTNTLVYTHITDDSGDDEQALIESQANSRLEIDISKSINHLNNIRTTTAPTTTTTTTQAATASKAKNCRGLIQKRAHTLDDFMEGNQAIRYDLCDQMSSTNVTGLIQNGDHYTLMDEITNHWAIRNCDFGLKAKAIELNEYQLA